MTSCFCTHCFEFSSGHSSSLRLAKCPFFINSYWLVLKFGNPKTARLLHSQHYMFWKFFLENVISFEPALINWIFWIWNLVVNKKDEVFLLLAHCNTTSQQIFSAKKGVEKDECKKFFFIFLNEMELFLIHYDYTLHCQK